MNNAGFVGLEYIQDRIDGTSTTSEEVRKFLIYLGLIKMHAWRS